MNIEQLKQVLDALKQAGVAEDEYFDFDHDIIYLPLHDEDTPVAAQLEAAGCHWNESGECWAAF